MSFVDIDDLSPRHMIAQYVIELRSSGHFLPYDDLWVIDRWLEQLADDADALLVILSDILPDYFAKRGGRIPPGLKGVEKSVTRKIRDRLVTGADGRHHPPES